MKNHHFPMVFLSFSPSLDVFNRRFFAAMEPSVRLVVAKQAEVIARMAPGSLVPVGPVGPESGSAEVKMGSSTSLTGWW